MPSNPNRFERFLIKPPALLEVIGITRGQPKDEVGR
jgi:hypothetical protein